MRLNSPETAAASARTRSVLAVPGTPSKRIWPSAKRTGQGILDGLILADNGFMNLRRDRLRHALHRAAGRLERGRRGGLDRWRREKVHRRCPQEGCTGAASGLFGALSASVRVVVSSGLKSSGNTDFLSDTFHLPSQIQQFGFRHFSVVQPQLAGRQQTAEAVFIYLSAPGGDVGETFQVDIRRKCKPGADIRRNWRYSISKAIPEASARR